MMLIPMVFLSIFSIFSGYFLEDFLSSTSTSLSNSLHVKPENFKQLDVEFIPIIYKLLATVVSVIGAALAIVICKFLNIQCTRLLLTDDSTRLLYESLCSGYYFDVVYNKFVAIKFLESCEACYITFDKEITEGILGPTSLSSIDNLFVTYKNKATVVGESSIKRSLCSIIISVLALTIWVNIFVCLFM